MKLITTYGLNTKRWYKHAACTILMLLVAVLSTACSNSESYPGLDWDVDKVGGDDDGGEGYGVVNDEDGYVMAGKLPVRVFLSEQSFMTTTATRGTGPIVVPDTTIEDKKHYLNSVFHLFAFRSEREKQGGLNYDASFESHAKPEDKGKDCLVDGYVNELGMPFKLKEDHSGTVLMKMPDMETDTTLYYYNENSEVGYNFFAYYIDDFKPTASNTHRTASQISYDLEIDGTQDIMMGSAPRLNKNVIDSLYFNLNLVEKDVNKILYPGNYSRTAALFGINPVVSMHHQLTRFRFLAYPSDEDADSVIIHSLTISSPYKGQMVVADNNLGNIGVNWNREERADIPLMSREKSADGKIQAYDETKLKVHWNQKTMAQNTNPFDNDSTVMGADMMLVPDSVYNLCLKYTHRIKKGAITRTVNYALRAPKIKIGKIPGSSPAKYWFAPSCIYTIKIAVYGLKPILVYVDVAGWADGGDLPIEI